MTRGIIETSCVNNRVEYYLVIDTMFDTIAIHTTSEKIAKKVLEKVNLCKHNVPYDYMLHDHTIGPKSD